MASIEAEEAPRKNGVAHAETNGQSMKGYSLATKAIHPNSKLSDYAYSPVVPPMYLTTTFEVREPGNAVYDYSRSDNPTRTELQRVLASIETAKYALAFSSGLGALTTVSYLLESGQNILCSDDVYGGTFRLFSRCIARMGIDTTYVDGTVVKNWVDNFKPGKTRLVWIDTPTNPTMKIIDIKSVVQEIKRLDEECIVVVDNTFITPVFQSPLKLGADMVMHSCSKYIGGHSDIIMGALMTNNTKLYEQLKFYQNSLGVVPGVFDCWLMIRSIKTLEIRVRHQTANAMKVAGFLESHKYVEGVLYPGLKSHPQHELCTRQCTGYGAMLSMYIKSTKGDEPSNFVRAVEVFRAAESLGCVCSLIEIPSLMTHASVPEENRNKLGITNNLLRLSIGSENVQDLISDLEGAFKKVYGN